MGVTRGERGGREYKGEGGDEQRGQLEDLHPVNSACQNPCSTSSQTLDQREVNPLDHHGIRLPTPSRQLICQECSEALPVDSRSQPLDAHAALEIGCPTASLPHCLTFESEQEREIIRSKGDKRLKKHAASILPPPSKTCKPPPTNHEGAKGAPPIIAGMSRWSDVTMGLGFRVSGFGFGIWGLGFGVWGVRLRV